MNISTNIRLNKSLETDGELAFFLFSVLAYIYLLADGPLLLDILMFTQTFYNIKNPTGSFGCLRVENKRTAGI